MHVHSLEVAWNGPQRGHDTNPDAYNQDSDDHRLPALRSEVYSHFYRAPGLADPIPHHR